MGKLLTVFAVALIIFAACNKSPEQQAGNTRTASESSNEKLASVDSAQAPSFHNALVNVASNLETNGSHLSVTHIDEDLKQLAEVMDGLLDVARQTSDEVPLNLSVVNLVNDLGLEKIDAVGRSSRWNESVWHNRLFIQTGGSSSGVLSVMGDEGTAWRAGEFAPADADMVVEFELNLRRLRQTMLIVSAAFGEQTQQGFLEAMQEKIANSSMTVGDLLGKMDIRATLVISLDREKRWNVSEQVELPTMLVTLRIERGMWLWKQFGEHIEADAEVSERDGLKFVKAPEEMDTPMGKLRPVIILDESKDVILVSLSEAYLEKCRSGKTTLSSSDDFKSATTGFPAKGNGLIYVSGDFCKELVEQVIQVRKNIPKDSEATALFDGLLGVSNLSADDVSHGYACCLANTKSGILIVGNSPMPDKGYGMMSSVAPISAMAAMATPMILKQKNKAQLIQVVSKMKQLYFLFFEYDQDEGKFPEQLEDLVQKGYLKQDTLTMLNRCHADSEDRSLVYIPGFSMSDHSATIIMHTPVPIDGKRAYLRIDGEVKTIKEAGFQQLMKAQDARE